MPPKKAAAALHPPYEQMVKAALVALKDRTGSSAQAIAKYMKANFKGLPDNIPKQLFKYLKRCVENEKLKKVKASYKLGTSRRTPSRRSPRRRRLSRRRSSRRSPLRRRPRRRRPPRKRRRSRPRR